MSKMFYDRIAETLKGGDVNFHKMYYDRLEPDQGNIASQFLRNNYAAYKNPGAGVSGIAAGIFDNRPAYYKPETPSGSYFTNPHEGFTQNLSGQFVKTIIKDGELLASAVDQYGNTIDPFGNTTDPQGNPVNTSSTSTGFFTEWIAEVESLVGRGAIIVLGFIFIAKGLSMFKASAATVVNVAKAAV